MKINEIAINENLRTDAAKLAGKALPRIERLPGETMKDAINRVKSELGGVKSADNLVSPEELSALRRDPVPPSSGTAVWRNPSTGEVSNVPPPGGGRIPPRPTGPGVTIDQLRTPTNGPAAMNIDSAKRAAQASAAKKAPAAKPAETPAPAADDLARQVSPGADPPMTSGGQADPEMIAEPLPSWLSPKGAKGSKTSGGQQSSGSKRDPSMDQPPPAGPGLGQPTNGIHLSKDEVLDLIKNKPGSAAAAAAAEKNPWLPKRIWDAIPLKKTTAATAIAGPELYNLLTPKDYSKFPDSVAHWPYNVGKAAWQNIKDNSGVPTITSVTPVSNNDQSVTTVAPPTQDAVNNAIKSDPANQSVTKEIDDWNKKHPDNQIKESYTNELNRIVFLSKL